MQTALKRVRRERGLTQGALSQATGLTKQVISNLERGASDGYPETWRRLATALGCTVDELWEGSESPKDHTPLPSESETFRREVAVATDRDLEQLWHQLREERVRLKLEHDDAPEDQGKRSEYLRAVERHQYVGWQRAARAMEKAEEGESTVGEHEGSFADSSS